MGKRRDCKGRGVFPKDGSSIHRACTGGAPLEAKTGQVFLDAAKSTSLALIIPRCIANPCCRARGVQQHLSVEGDFCSLGCFLRST